MRCFGHDKEITMIHLPALWHRAEAHLATGVRLRYVEQGAAGAHPIIMLHGYADSWYSFSGVLPLLYDTYHVYALDQRGHGDSDRPERGYHMSDLAADVLAFMDAMGLPSATVVGHSMGSLVAQQLAIAAPDRVARLVLIGAAANARVPSLLELQQAVDALDDPIPPEFAYEFQASTTYQALSDAFLDRVVVESLKLPARVWRAALAGLLAADYTAQLSRIRVPALMLWGEQDTVFSRAEQDTLAAGLADVVLKVYPATGHALHWERPEQFVCDLEDFIAQSELR
jgi:pimeloyl-ACP methyl ester carboxylesterase